MNEESPLMATLRAEELRRRQERRDRLREEITSLYKRCQNEGNLLEEVLSEMDQEIHKQALSRIQRQDEEHRRELVGGFFSRLAWALWGFKRR